MIVVFLVLAGLCLGSFVNALVWRVHQQSNARSKAAKQKFSILYSRSVCVHCKHQLAAADLIPVLSWLALKGRCRYCKKPISWQYPLVELVTAGVFVASYIFWPSGIHTAGSWLLFVTWLMSSVGLIALLVYDLRWMLLPSRILYPTFFVALTGRLGYIVFFSHDKAHSFGLLLFSLVVSSGIFWLLFQLSRGTWIGFGDVRLGLVTGTLLADPAKALAVIFIASLLGSIIAMPGLITGKKSMSTKLPYGPFLILAAAIMLIFGSPILDWYKSLLGVGI